MPTPEEQLREYASWLQRTWPHEHSAVPGATDPTPAPHRRWMAAAACAVLVAGGAIWALSGLGDSNHEDLVVAATTTIANSATSTPTGGPGSTPPRYSTGGCVETPQGEASGPIFPGVDLPPDLELRESRRFCGVTAEQFLSDTYHATSANPDHTRRVILHRVEQRTFGTKPAGDEPTAVNGKPAMFSRIGPNTQIAWDQDANGSGIVLTQGYDDETTIAIAESFDRVVAETGPRVALEELTRSEALDRARYMTSTLRVDREREEAKRMTWADIAAASDIATTRPLEVTPETIIWVIAGTGTSFPEDGRGEPVDTWGVLIFDALTAETLAVDTGGSADGTTWPPYFDALPDRPT